MSKYFCEDVSLVANNANSWMIITINYGFYACLQPFNHPTEKKSNNQFPSMDNTKNFTLHTPVTRSICKSA